MNTEYGAFQASDLLRSEAWNDLLAAESTTAIKHAPAQICGLVMTLFGTGDARTVAGGDHARETFARMSDARTRHPLTMWLRSPLAPRVAFRVSTINLALSTIICQSYAE